jgi:hypothetical protein
MQEKTELEKRWEEEEVEATPDNSLEGAMEGVRRESEKGCGGDCECNESCEALEDDQNAFDYILSPFCGVEAPLALAIVNNRMFLGGLLHMNTTEDRILLHYPMVYLEIPDPGNPGSLQVGVQKIFQGLPIPDKGMWFRYDGLDILEMGKRALKLAKLYEDTVNEIKYQESGLARPSAADFAKINNG